MLSGAALPALHRLHVHLDLTIYVHEDGRELVSCELLAAARPPGTGNVVDVKITGPVELVEGFDVDRIETMLASRQVGN
jgi:hypothetical protein